MKTLIATIPFTLGLLMTGSVTGLAAQDSSAPEPRTTISNRLPRLDTDGTIVAEGDDPCYGTVKTLKVSYRFNGQPADYTGTDPETVDLLEQE